MVEYVWVGWCYNIMPLYAIPYSAPKHTVQSIIQSVCMGTWRNVLFVQRILFAVQIFNWKLCFSLDLYVWVNWRRSKDNGISIWHSGPFPPSTIPMGQWKCLLSIKCHKHSHAVTHAYAHNRELWLTGYLWRHIYWWSLWQTWTVSWRSECSRVGPLALHQDHPNSPLQEAGENRRNDAWIKHCILFLFSVFCLFSLLTVHIWI